MWGAKKIHFSNLPQNPEDWKDAVVASFVASFQLKWELLRKAGGGVAKVTLNLRTWFLQDTNWGQGAFPGCSCRWESQPSLQHWAPGSSPSPPAAAHSQAGRASLWLPCSRAAQSNSPGDLLRFLPRILFRVLCNRREMENLSDQTGLWNHPETRWIFIIAGCLELAWEWKKKPNFWKTTIFCGLEGYWIFYVGNTGSLMGQ